MGLRDRLKQLAAEAVEVARSEETQQRVAETKAKMREVAESDTAQRILKEGRAVADEMLDRLGEGDTPIQAAAKTAKAHMNSGEPDPAGNAELESPRAEAD